jgi:hypothetical protein
MLRAQSQPQDIVYLKNGSMIRGKIMERDPSKSLKIEMSDGSVFVFKADEIDSVHLTIDTKEPIKESHEHHLYLGVRVGADLGDETDGVNSLEFGQRGQTGQSNYHFMEVGILAGGQLDYWFADSWALSVGLLYDQKGAGLNFHYNNGEGEYPDIMDVTLDYLEIPILLKAKFGSGNLKPYMFAGPSVGVLLSGKETNSPVIQNESGFNVPLYQKNQPSISAVAGLGLSFDLGSGAYLFFDAAYAWGLTDDSFGQVGTGYSGETLYKAASRDIRIAAGIMFPLD